MFLNTLITVALMMVYALFGFGVIKFKLMKKESIPDFAKLLMYICQPFLLIYSFNSVDFENEMFIKLAIILGVVVLTFAIFLLIFYILFRKKYKDNVAFRIYTIASCFGNVGFLGIPILEAVLPGSSFALVCSALFLVGMNEIGWTIGSMIVSQNKKYLSWKMIFFNPSMIGMYVAIPLFFLKIKVPNEVLPIVTVLARMTTPLCMLILGMRLATSNLKTVFGNYKTYIMVFVKQIIMPLIMFLIVWWLPIDLVMKQALVILASAPIASVVLNFAEMVGEGQEDAASLVLCGTILCILTMPLMTLLIS